jgi:hypothetical protein
VRRHTRSVLRGELRAVGATTAEINDLMQLAAGLGRLRKRRTVAIKGPIRSRLVGSLRPVAFMVFGLTLGSLLAAVSQTVSPTSHLYPLQKFADNVAVEVHPQYSATVMMKRAQQINMLVTEGASSRQILASLADYTKEAGVYTSMYHTNYAASDFCKYNLEQAASSASPPVKRAIATSLRSLETT